MRIAFIADIHGNFPAFMHVYKDAIKNGVDKFIFVGDYIFDMPFSNETAHFLMKLDNAHVIKGNKEMYLARLANDNQETWIYNQMGVIYQTYRDLAPDARDYLNNLADELYMQVNPSLSIYAAHVPGFLKQGTKTNCNSSNYHRKMMTKPFTHEEFLLEFNDIINTDACKAHINQIDANIIVFGHNHLQSHAYCGNKLILNPGSCGLPLDFNRAASYTILDETKGKLTVIEKRVPYDVEATITQIKKSILYEKGKIWSDLIILALKTGRDYIGFFFEIAGKIASSKHEKGPFFSNETWQEANEAFSIAYLT